MSNKYVITKVINEWDPIGLFPACPNDEYSIEIEEIFSLSNNSCISAKELGEIIFDVFNKYFDSLFTKSVSECTDVAKIIMCLSNTSAYNEN